MSNATKAYTTSDLADRVGGELSGRGDLQIVGVNSIEDAKPQEITFIADARHCQHWQNARAGAAVASRGLDPPGHDLGSRALIVVPDAELAMIQLLSLFEPPIAQPGIGIHATAVTDPTATIGRDVRIGPHVSIADRAIIGDGVVLHAGVCVYAQAQIGEGSVLHANTVVRERCTIGRRVILHPNVSIGPDGFGYRPAPDGSGVLKVPHIGTVVVEDDVEIGANSCIDRGKFGTTTIGAGTKIDNLVHIGHNCRVGGNCVIAGLSGLSGSVTVGDWVRIGGGVSVKEHVRVGDGATIGGHSGVMRDIPPGSTHFGTPADEASQILRQWACMRKLPAWMQRVSHLLKVGGT